MASCTWAAKSNFISALERGEAQTIVCYGTSLTQSGSWVQGLSEALNARWPDKATVINSGMSGKNSSEGLSKIQEKVLSKNPDAVFIEFSMNDAADSLNSGKTPEEALVQAEDNLKRIIEAIKSSNPSCEIILQTMNPYVKAPDSTLSNRTGLENHVTMYRRVAEEGGYLLIDNWPSWMQILAKGEAEYLNFVPDGVHPNESASRTVTLHNICKMLEIVDGWTVSENMALTGDVVVDALSVEEGVTLDLAGYTLYCTSLAGSGTITSLGETTDLTSPSGVVTWSTNGGTAQTATGNGANLFNDTSPTTDSDCSNNEKRVMVTPANLPLAVTYDFGEGNAQKVNMYKIHFARPNLEKNSGNWSRGPKTWTFEGSNDGETWEELDAKDGVTWLTKNCSPKEFSVANDAAYRYYRMTFTASSSSQYLELHQLEYFHTGELHVNTALGTTATVPYSVTVTDKVKVVTEVNGGTVNATGDFYLGKNAGATGSMTVNGGIVTQTGSSGRTLLVGDSGTGTLTLNGGAVTMNHVRDGFTAGGSGTINLNGGTLSTQRIYTRSGETGKLNFNGGTLKALAKDPNTGGLVTAETTVNVGENGGTIDSGNFEITVGAAIHGTGAMRFKGGSTITLSGASDYTGGTTINLGTKIVTSNATAKNTILGNLVIDGRDLAAAETGIVVFEFSGLTDEDVPTVTYKNCGPGTKIYRDGDVLKVDFDIPLWELEADVAWSDLVAEYGAPAADTVVRIVSSGRYTLTIDTDVTVAKLVFTGTNPDVVVNSGSTVTTDTITFSGSGANYLKNDGVVVLNGAGTTTLPFHNDSRGAYYVNNGGRLDVSRVTQGITTPGFTPEGTNQFVCVGSGAIYDVRGVADNTASVRLATGAMISNGSETSVTTSNNQTPHIVLDGDATAKIYRSFGLVGANNSETRLDLGSHTLTINGGGTTYSFFLDNTTVTGTGKILVAEGKLCACESSSGEKFTLEIGESGQLVLDKASGGTANTDFTVGDFVNNGTDNSLDNGGSLVVKGTLSPGNAIKKLKLANGATVKASASKVQTVTTQFSASGTITIDATAITKEQLSDAENHRIPVLTVPTVNAGGSWSISNSPIPGTFDKWVGNGDSTSTLYLCKPTGFKVIVR